MLSIVTMRPGVGFGLVHVSTRQRRYPGIGIAPNFPEGVALSAAESNEDSLRVGDHHVHKDLGRAAALH
jgi:hypothetical protein